MSLRFQSGFPYMSDQILKRIPFYVFHICEAREASEQKSTVVHLEGAPRLRDTHFYMFL